MKGHSLVVPIAIAIGGIIVAAAVYLTLQSQEPSTAGSGNPALVRPVGPADHILGNPQAKVVIVEYSDFDCSYCKTFHTTLHDAVTKYGAEGKVAWVFRNYPLTELHPNALKHAEAAECVAKASGNDAYWKFADLLFSNQPTNPTRYSELALKSGADPAAVGACIVNAAAQVDPQIMADRQNAQDIGALGTPYSLIVVTGKAPVVVDGAWPADALDAAIESALAP